MAEDLASMSAEDIASLSNSLYEEFKLMHAVPEAQVAGKSAWDEDTLVKEQSDKLLEEVRKMGGQVVGVAQPGRPAPIRERTPYEVKRDFSRDPEENKIFQEEASRNQFKNMPVVKQWDELGVPLSSALQAVQGVERGAIEGIGSGARSIESTVARLTGGNADAANRDADAITQSQDQSWGPRTARGISSSLTQAIPASRLGGVPAVVSYFGASEYNQALTQAKDAGFTESDQYKYALAKGINEAAITSVFSAAPLLLKKVPGLGNFITGGTERILSEGMKAQTTREFIKELAKDLGSETAEELTMLAVSNHIEDRWEMHKGETPEQRDTRLGQGFWDTVSQTVGSVGIAGGASAIGSRLNEAKSRTERQQMAEQVKDLDMGEHNELRDKFVASPSRENLNALKAAILPVTKPVEPQTDPNFGMTPESAPDAGDETLPEQQTEPAQQTPENFSPEQNVVTATEQRTDVKENRQEGQGNQEGLLTQSNLEPESFAQQPLASTAAEQQPPGGSGLRGAELDENRATTKALAVGAPLSPDEKESLAELVTTLSGMPKEAVQLQIVNSGLASTIHQNDLHFFSESISQGGGKEAADTLRKSAVRQREKLLEEKNNEPLRILSEISRLQELIKDFSAKTISPTYVSTDPHTGHSVVLKKSESRLIAAEESKRKAIASASEKIDELTARLEEIKNSSQTTELAPVGKSAPVATSEPILVGASNVIVGKPRPLSPEVELTGVSEWTKSAIDSEFQVAVRNGTAFEIEKLAAQGHTAKQIATSLGVEENAVLAVRAKLGIPSMNMGNNFGASAVQQKSDEFVKWRDEYNKRSFATVKPAKPKYTPLQTPPEQMTVDQIQRELGNKPSQSRMEELTRSLESKQSRVPSSQEQESPARTPDVAQVKPAAPFVAKETPNESSPVSVAPIASQQPSVSPNAAKEYAPIVMSTPASQAPPVASQAVTPVEKGVSLPVTPVSLPVTPVSLPVTPVSLPVTPQQTPRSMGPGLAARRAEAATPTPRTQVQAPPTTWQEAFERFTKKASPATVPREQATAAARTAAERLERFTGVTVVIVHSDDNKAMTAAMHLPMGERKSFILINNRIMANSEVMTDKEVWKLVGDELSHAAGVDSGNWLDREELADWSEKYLELVPDWYQEDLRNDPEQLKKEATAMWLSNTFFQDADVQKALFNTNPPLWKQIVDALLSVFRAKPSLEKSLSPQQFAIYKTLTERLIEENGTVSDADSGSYTFEKLLSDYKRIGGLNDEQVEAMRSIWEGFARNVAKMKNANEFVAKYIKGMSEANVEGQVGILMQPAYQGSGKLFEKHSSEHFGTGEGHAAYGVGHYFTDDLGVAGHYREVASRNIGGRESVQSTNSRNASRYNISIETVEFLGGKQGSLHTARDLAMDSVVRNQRLADQDVNELAMGIAGIRSWDQLPNYQLDEYQAYDEHEPLMRREDFIEQAEEELRDYYDVWHKYRRIAEDIEHLIKSGKEYKPVKPGVIYQVELAPTDDELFLWDKPISEQPAKVKDAMGKIAERYGIKIAEQRWSPSQQKRLDELLNLGPDKRHNTMIFNEVWAANITNVNVSGIEALLLGLSDDHKRELATLIVDKYYSTGVSDKELQEAEVESAINYLKSNGITDPRSEYGYKNDNDYVDLAVSMGFRRDAPIAKYGSDFYKALATALAFINKPSAEASRKIREIDALSYDIDTATITEDDGAIYTKISKELKEWINNFLGKQVVTNSEYNPGHYRVEMSGSAFSNMLKSFSIELEYERKSLLPLLMTEKQQYKLASETLLHYGVRGNKHYTRDTRTGRSQETKYNYVIFSDDDVEITAVYLQRDGQANGAVRLWEDGSALLYSFKTANFSTHVHEFAHIARQHLTGDDAVLANTYVGATSNDWSEEQEEKFANGFERFLREGNIEGTNHMRSLWERMKSWMVGIYKTITRGSRLDIVVSKEVQKVYAKMIGAEPGAKFEDLGKQLTEKGQAMYEMVSSEIRYMYDTEDAVSEAALKMARAYEKAKPEVQEKLESSAADRQAYFTTAKHSTVDSMHRAERAEKRGGKGRVEPLKKEGKEFSRLITADKFNYAAVSDERFITKGIERAARKFQQEDAATQAKLTSSKSDRVEYVRTAIDEAFAGAEDVTRIVSADFENPVTGTSLAGEIQDTRELPPDEALEKQEFIEFAQEIATDVGDDPAVIMGFDAKIKTDKSTPGHISKAEYARQKNTTPYYVNEAIKKAENRAAQIQAAKGIGSPTMSPGYAALLNNSPPPPPNQNLNGDTVVHGTQAIRKRIEQGPLKLTIGLGKPRSFDPTTGEKAPAEYKRTGEYATFLANTIGYARLIAHEVGHHISNTTTVFNFMGTKARIDIGHIITQAANHNAAMPGQDMTKFITRLQRRGASPETIKAVAERRYNDAMNEAIRQFGTPTLEQRLAMDDLRGLDPMVITFNNPNHPLHRPKSRGNIEEGFAEFMRHVAEGDAATVAPKAYAQYVAWAQTQPEVAKEVEAVMKMLGDYLRASPNQKMKTQIANDGHTANAAESTMKDRGIDYVRSLKDGIAQEVDQSSVLRTLQQMVAERGHIKRPGQLDMVTAFNVLFGSAAKHGTRAFLDGVHYIHNTQYDVKVSGLSFDQEMMAAGLTIDEQDTLVEFMLAQQKLEIEDKINSVRRANGQKEYVDTDLSLDDARTIIAEVRKNPELYNKFLHLHDVYVRVYRDLYDMYSKATGLPAMETPLDKYVALKRVFDDNGSLSEQGRSFTTPKTPFKSRTLGGATLPIVHPFDSLRRDINKFYDLATQHQFWTTVYNATDSDRGGADGMGDIVQRMPHDVEVTKDTLEKLFPDMAKQLLAAGVSQQAIDEIDTNPFAMQVVVTMFKIIHQPSAAKGEVVHIETDYYDPATGQVVPLSKPRLVTYKWNKDMYSMLSQLGMSWKQTDIARKVPWLFNTFNFFSKTFKKFAINRNPEFAMRNRLHDQAQFMERSKETTVAERFTAPLLADADITKYRTKAITGHHNAITEMFMFDVGSMASQGGERSRSIEGDVVHMRTKSSIKAGENNLGYRTVDALASADHAFQVGLSLMEMAPRLAEYKAAIRNDGYSVDKDGHVIETATGQRTQLPYDVRMRATSAAMDVTINFAHAGPWVQLAETIFPLFSAAVTSQKQKFAYRAEMVKGLLKGDKKAMGWAAVVTGFIAAGMAEYLMYRDDEEWNEQEYWQRRQWVDLGWFRLLKGRDTGIFTNAGVAIAAAIDGNWDASYGMLSSDIMGQRVPFADEIPAPRPILDVGYEVWANKDLFTGKPIDTDVETKNLLPGDRGVGRTATTSQAMGYATGYSPNIIEHVLNRISGGAYERTMKGADSATGFANDVIKGKETKSWRAKDIPMVGQFVDWNPHRRSEAEMKDAAARTEQSIGSHKLRAPKEGDDATLWNARNTDLHNASYRYDRANKMRGELYSLWREAKGDTAKQSEIMALITGTARAALKKEGAAKFPNPFAPNTMIPEYARPAVKKELIDVLNKATENLITESRKKKNDASDMQIIAARQLLKENGWTVQQLEGLLNEAMPKWTEAKRNRLMLLRRVM